MSIKILKQRLNKQKDQPNIYMQKTKGPKIFASSPNLDQRYKSKTLLNNNQNIQPNIPLKQLNKPLIKNSFGAAKMMVGQQSLDNFKLHLDNQKNLIQSKKQSFNQRSLDFHGISKSTNFQKCSTQRVKPFSKKHLKTQQCQYNYNELPTIADCQFTKSQYQSSQDSNESQKLVYSKTFNKKFNKNNQKHILIHESLNFDNLNRDTVTFGRKQQQNLKRYQFSRQEEKKMKNQIVNNIIRKSKAQLMRSCDFDNLGHFNCSNHPDKKAKYRLNAVRTQQQEENFYCSKCAVRLAKQGFDIQQLTSSDRRMIMSRLIEKDSLRSSMQILSMQAKRNQQFISFQKRFQALKEQFSSKLQNLSRKSQQIIKIDKNIQLTISNYDNIIQILNQMRNQEIQKQENLRKRKRLDFVLKKDELSKILMNIKDTASDLNKQKNNLLTLKNKEFAFMLDCYVNKITYYQNYLTNFDKTQLASQIAAFDENISAQDIDQQTIIQNIFAQMFNRFNNSKLQAIRGSSKQSYLSKHIQTQTIPEAGMESGGSSMMMFHCDQQETSHQKLGPFRVLFNNNKLDQSNILTRSNCLSNSNMNNSMNVMTSAEIPPSQRSVKYLKETNFKPQMHNF